MFSGSAVERENAAMGQHKVIEQMERLCPHGIGLEVMLDRIVSDVPINCSHDYHIMRIPSTLTLICKVEDTLLCNTEETGELMFEDTLREIGL